MRQLFNNGKTYALPESFEGWLVFLVSCSVPATVEEWELFAFWVLLPAVLYQTVVGIEYAIAVR